VISAIAGSSDITDTVKRFIEKIEDIHYYKLKNYTGGEG